MYGQDFDDDRGAVCMSLPRYPEYKASGAAWLGEVPRHWGAIRYKNVFVEKNSIVGAALPSGSISFGRVVFKDDEFLLETTKASYQEVLSGEFLINPINLNYDLKSLRTALSEIDTCVSPAYIVLKSKAVSDKSYLKYQLHMFDLFHMKTLGAGVRQTITFNDIGGCYTVLPPLFEQTQIAAFLDRETGKIDALIAEQRRLVELLAEKRQAVISHAVTKGLNPNAKMKDSGIEWLGEVPEHWDVCTARRVIERIEQGWSPECESRPAEPQEWGVLKAGCVNRGLFNEDDNKALPENLQPILEYEVHKGDVLMSRASGSPDLVGSVAFVELTRPHLMLSDKIFRIKLNIRFSPRFFVSLFNSSLLRAQIVQSISGAEGLANNLPQSSMKRFFITLPLIEEQQSISAFLDTETAKFDTLTAEANRAIELLQERRSALISAAVTGKVDVRKFT